MAVAVSSPIEKVILRDVSWRFYESLLTEIGESSPATRITYDNGLLQIAVVSAGHDTPNRTLAEMVSIVAEETATDYCPVGSTTFQRPDLLKGFEPDSAFYFRHAAFARDADDIDLTVDPPPELVIEVDRTRDSLNRFPIFAAVGVAEVWRCSEGAVTMHALAGDGYREVERSIALPALTAFDATRLLADSRKFPRLEWIRRVRACVSNAQRAGGSISG